MLKAKETIGVSLTESYAMYPAASVSGYVFAQKDAQYFNVGKIQQDQVEEYAVRKGQTIDTIKNPNLGLFSDRRASFDNKEGNTLK